MEINIMPGGIAQRATTRVRSSLPAEFACPRIAPTAATRSQGGVGSAVVMGMWQTGLATSDPRFTDQSFTDQKFYDHKFTTRQGPPICSPPA